MLFYDGHKVYMNGQYPAVCLHGKSYHVHRLEWEKYNGKIPPGYIVHHKNENKLDWSISNLELLSRSEHLLKHKNIVKRSGIKVIAIKAGISIDFESIDSAAKICGVSPVSIRRCLCGKQYQTKGWIFERV